MRSLSLLALCLGAACGAAAGASTSGTSGPPSGATGTVIPVLEHHASPRRGGAFRVPELTRAAAAKVRRDTGFLAALPGSLYAQPLYVPGAGGAPDLLVAASERNVVGAFDPTTGAALWTRTLAPPVPLSALPCGNIDPLGVTGTPVVDPAARTLYLDAMTTPDGGRTKRHLVYALSLADGATRPGWPVDVGAALGPAFDPAVQNQRGALALQGGVLYVPYGGHYGDCGDYRGWLLGIRAADPAQLAGWRTGARGGGSWGPSGVSSADGRVFLATGNTFGTTTWAGGEAVLAFTAGDLPGTAPLDWFAPANWKELDDGDVDIGGSGPVLVDLPGATPAALAVALGKDGKAYLLDRGRLGNIGGQLAVSTVSSEEIITAAAAYAAGGATYVVFRGAGVGCPAGQSGDLTALRLVPGAPPRAGVAWCAREGGRGSPIATSTDGSAEGVVWVVGAEGDEALHAFAADTGAGIGAPVAVGATVRRFQSPVVSNGRIYVAADGGVRAFVWGP
jgi:hypothetical protein